MTNSVNLYLASGVYDGLGFWLVDFTEEENILNSLDGKLLECYRKELFGLDAAIEIREVINSTLDIIVVDSISFRDNLGKSIKGDSFKYN